MLFCVNTFYSQFGVREGEKLQTMNLGFRQGRCLTPNRLLLLHVKVKITFSFIHVIFLNQLRMHANT